MKLICEKNNCTGCGLCADLCPHNAINLKEGLHGFVFPEIDASKCTNCGLCQNKCPSNNTMIGVNPEQSVYAAWNINKGIRKHSTSGGVFYALARYVIRNGGLVVGVAWDDNFHPKHIVVDKEEKIFQLQGSKYSQSNTSGIYKKVKEYLRIGKKVLFSGTPCQVAAMKAYVGEEENLLLVDVVCHGVPSNKMLDRYYSQFKNKIARVALREKDPYWDYTYVKIDFDNEKSYKELTIDDPYFNLFNIGYSLRFSCHNCKYSNTNRIGDITLADFWGYIAHNFKTRNYNKGTSLVLVNTAKGKLLFDEIKEDLGYELSDIEIAKKGNKCLSESFVVDKALLEEFWKDYEDGFSVSDLNKKYCEGTFKLPNHIMLRRIYYKWKWIIGR